MRKPTRTRGRDRFQTITLTVRFNKPVTRAAAAAAVRNHIHGEFFAAWPEDERDGWDIFKVGSTAQGISTMNPRPIKIGFSYDQWLALADATLDQARAHERPDLLRLAAAILGSVGHSATRNATEAEAERLEARITATTSAEKLPAPSLKGLKLYHGHAMHGGQHADALVLTNSFERLASIVGTTLYDARTYWAVSCSAEEADEVEIGPLARAHPHHLIIETKTGWQLAEAPPKAPA